MLTILVQSHNLRVLRNEEKIKVLYNFFKQFVYKIRSKILMKKILFKISPFKIDISFKTSTYKKILPFHPLQSKGYFSVGCTHCTKPGKGRDGRWNNSPKTEFSTFESLNQ